MRYFGICLIVTGLAVGVGAIWQEGETASPSLLDAAFASIPASGQDTDNTRRPIVSTVVMLPPKGSAPIHPIPPAQDPASKNSFKGPGLARELQAELSRVGCYGGEISGTWNASTRDAMKAFLERVNARLPADEPDAVLLALLQNHPRRVCGACPREVDASADGNCPHSDVATHVTAKITEPPLEDASALRTPDEQPLMAIAPHIRKGWGRTRRAAPIEGRMSIGASGIAPPRPIQQRPGKLAAADPDLSVPLPVKARKGRHGARHASARHHAYLRPMRPMRYAYRPFRRPRGLLAAFFGL